MVDVARGLLYEPTYENEVVLLFGLLIPYFEDKFVIDRYFGSFPDCLARRNGEEIGIEFEVLASDFYDHRHDEHPDLARCKLLVCWENDLQRKTITKGGKSFLVIKDYEIEVLALREIVDELRKKGIVLVGGKRPDIGEANKERFFKQLEENVEKEKFEWIKKLYDEVSLRREFEVRWGGGGTWFTMRFFAKEWGVDPLLVQGNGSIWVGYTGNPAIHPWVLPQETQDALRQLFKRKKEKERWHTVPLSNIEDLNKIREALNIIAEHSKHLKLQWQNDDCINKKSY
jgi:hypothetical protein